MPDKNGKTFQQRVMEATPGGEALIKCLQCGTCGGSCPSGDDMDNTPRGIFALIAAEMKDEVLSSNTPWHCVSCYSCIVRCPQEIPITSLMYTIKQMAITHEKYQKNPHADWSTSFIGFLERYGRSFELGLATRYHLTHHPLSMISKGMLGLSLLRKGRLNLTPERIKNMPQLTAILNEAKRIAAQKEV